MRGSDSTRRAKIGRDNTSRAFKEDNREKTNM
jgi:hypothetical protein